MLCDGNACEIHVLLGDQDGLFGLIKSYQCGQIGLGGLPQRLDWNLGIGRWGRR